MEKLQSADDFPPTPGERVEKALHAAVMIATSDMEADSELAQALVADITDGLIAWGQLKQMDLKMHGRPYAEDKR